MMSVTARLGLPMLAPGQAQKELFHNEALQQLELIVAAVVEEPPRSSPPADPAIGSCYIVGPGAAGPWSGREGALAGFTAGGWRFVQAPEGLAAYVRTTGSSAVYRQGTWSVGELHCEKLIVNGTQVVGTAAAPVAAPEGGANVDQEARAAIISLLAALRQHGLIRTG